MIINNNTKLVYNAYINAYFVTKYLLNLLFYNKDVLSHDHKGNLIGMKNDQKFLGKMVVMVVLLHTYILM
jgi:hypothetical protein